MYSAYKFKRVTMRLVIVVIASALMIATLIILYPIDPVLIT